jgi:hypothetical protein
LCVEIMIPFPAVGVGIGKRMSMKRESLSIQKAWVTPSRCRTKCSAAIFIHVEARFFTRRLGVWKNVKP